MKPRTCRVVIAIANDRGASASYSLSPLPAADLGQSVAAFRLVNLTEPPFPVYTVRLALAGLASCDCPAYLRAGQCKHADALVAAGVLPTAFLSLLQDRDRLLAAAEAECQRLAEAAMMERTVFEHDAAAAAEELAEVRGELAAVAARAVQAANRPGGPAAAPPARPASSGLIPSGRGLRPRPPLHGAPYGKNPAECGSGQASAAGRGRAVRHPSPRRGRPGG